MSEIAFIHLSDIHFHKSSGNSADIDADLRNSILIDIKENAKSSLQNVKGILVGGDITFSGQREEYSIAKAFLKDLTMILEIDEKNIFCVPGNHDVDRQIIRSSKIVFNAQLEIEKAETLDSADILLQEYILDSVGSNMLFSPIKEYNEFAVAYGCNIQADKLVWTEEFCLDHNMKLKICGMNSCIISSHKDRESGENIRKMVVGQSQIPPYEEDVTWVTLCHHPVQFWKFADDIQPKLDKRVDIQLYGHKHEHAIDANSERLVVSAGATHPERGKDWMPRYNWISFECLQEDGDRFIAVKTYPRVLSEDRDRFEPDIANCDDGYIYCDYKINIDDKRRKNLRDENVSFRVERPQIDDDSILDKDIKKEIVYNFFDLSYVQQNEILVKLHLFKEDYAGKRYIEIIDKILEDASEKGCLEQFEKLIKQKGRV